MTRQLSFRLDPDEIIVDSFAGGGGASLGIQWALGHGPHIAINHDKEAIALHAANHPDSEHYPEDVWRVDPVVACRGRRVGLMWLSPDCKHFSKAKGGKPVSKKIRGLAWTAVRWASAVRPRVIVLENVEEFQTWGPVDRETSKPIVARRGQTFRAFVHRLDALGYVVEWRELRACDYGAPTIRKRLFLIARCDGQPIAWPSPMYGKGWAHPWRTAAECIQWEIPCPSIFERKKALADNTLRRIARGIDRFVINSPKPFIVSNMNNNVPRGVDEPMSTILGGNHKYLTTPRVAPIVIGSGGPAYQGEPRSANLPHRTVLSESNAALVVPSLVHFKSDAPAPVTQPFPTQTSRDCFGLTAPLLVPTTHEGDTRAHSLEEPARTITGAHRGEHALIAPFLKPRYGEDPDPRRRNGAGQAPRVRSLEEPAPVIVPTGNGGDLVAAFMAKHYGGVIGAELTTPVPTITATDHNALVAPSLVKFKGTSRDGQPIDEPLHTVQSAGLHYGEVRAFLAAFYGTAKDGSALVDPMRTVTPKDRFALVTVEGIEYAIVDIGMRMLAPRELYRAQGFPDSYRIDVPFKGKPLTKTAQVRMCGNSVCPPLAAAIISANLLGVTFAPKELVA